MEKKELNTETTSTITIDPQTGDVTEQIQKIIEQQNNNKPMNRAQRRAMAKQNKKREKQLQRYLINHPEAMKIELDEEAVKKVEEEEAKKNIITNGHHIGHHIEEIIDVPFTEVAEDTIETEE